MDEASDENELTPKNKEINPVISQPGIYSEEMIRVQDMTTRIIMPLFFTIGKKLEIMHVQL